jgi:HSP20 family protein
MLKDINKDLQKTDTSHLAGIPEQTRPGVTHLPAVDIFEDDHRISILADMPGVTTQDLKIDLRESVLTLSGRSASPESTNETYLLREYLPGTFFRQFTLSEMIDQSKIDARLSNGVLRLELPKVERAKPRQISVQGS